jgi:AraC-like DNA-binding protein/quercetin dioxygenase-like cupin family protein
MAKSTSNLSKSALHTAPDGVVPRAARQAGCRYLFHGRVKMEQHRSVPLHHHPFWHLDIHVSGTALLLTRRGRTQLNPGDVYFIPAGVPHGFSYPDLPADFLTLKVAVLGREGDEILFAKPSPLVSSIRRALLEATPRIGVPTPDERPTIELLAAALIAHCYPESAAAPSSAGELEAPLVASIKTLVGSAQGKIPSVKAVAQRMGYSISHVTSRFRAAEGVPLKRYLDEERRRAAVWLMEYSDQCIGDVAQALEFPDIYSFSRFFKRMTGKCPREFRKGSGVRA